jgi:hypothetical protein
MRRFGNPWRSFLACLPAALVLATPAIAGEYMLRLGVDQHFEYNNNIDFTPDNETAASSYTLAPGVGLDGHGERWELGLDLSTPFERYTESRLNTDNQEFRGAYLRTLLKGSVGVEAHILRDSTHNIDEAGFVERTANRRVLDSLSAHWTRQIGGRHQITLTGSGQKVKYDASLSCSPDGTCTGSQQLNDYDYGAAQVDWTRLMTERTSTVLNLSWTHFRSDLPPDRQFVSNGLPPLDRPQRTSDTFALQGGLTHIFNEKLSGQFMFGARHSENEVPLWHADCLYIGTVCLIVIGAPQLVEDTSTDTSGQAMTSINYKGSRLELDVSLSQTLVPSGRGGLLDSRELATDLSYQLRERLYLLVSATALRNESDDTLLTVPETDPQLFAVSKLDRKYFSLRPRMHWRFMKHWSLDGGVEYRSHELLNFFNPATPLPVTLPPSNDASAGSVFLTLGYNAEPIPVFR